MLPSDVPQEALDMYPGCPAREIGKPPGYSEEEIGGLPAIIDMRDPRFPAIKSYWRPNELEMAALVRGGYIELEVIAHQMVPVAMNVIGGKAEE